MTIVNTIIPIFTIVLLGWFARSKGYIPIEFIGPANWLTYYLAIPAMIFRSISKASLKSQFHVEVILITLGTLLITFGVVWGIGVITRINKKHFGSFLQSSIHGNLGYIGLAVSYYYLGNEGFVRASIIAGFLMILHNFLAVFALQFYANSLERNRNPFNMVLKVVQNPIVIASAAGIAFSGMDITMPDIMGRSLDILSNLALPMALLIIGASLSFAEIRIRFFAVLSSTMFKLILLPGLGLVLYHLFGITSEEYIPGLILLASPTATAAYVMAKEMHGDPDFAVAAIFVSTILSAITFSLWLNIKM